MGNFRILPPLAPRAPPSAIAVFGVKKEHRTRFLISNKPVGPRRCRHMEPCQGMLGARRAVLISGSEVHEVFVLRWKG